MDGNLSSEKSLSYSFGAKKALGVLIVSITVMIATSGIAAFLIDRIIESSFVTFSKNDSNLVGAKIALQHLAIVIANSVFLYYFLKIKSSKELKKETLTNIGFVSTTPKWIFFSALSGFLYVFILGHFISPMFPPDSDFVPNPLVSETQTGDWVQYLMALIVVCLVPIIEEVLFRGILYRGFSESWGKIPAAIVVIILFVLLHNETLAGGYWLSIFALSSLSISSLLARELSGSLMPSVLIHAGFNLAIAF